MMQKKLIDILREQDGLNPDDVRRLLDSGLGVDECDERGITPLIYVANRFDAADVLQLLIDRGASVRVRDEMGRTALMAAVIGNHLASVRVLIKNMANVNARTVDGGVMPLNFACSMPGVDLEIVRELLDAGAMQNTPDSDGSSPILSAIRVGRADVVELLIDRGAMVNKSVIEMARFYPKFAKTDIGRKIIESELS